jgi:ribonuclease P protein component
MHRFTGKDEPRDFSFRPGERLKSRKLIQRLFAEGHSFGQYPLRVVWLEVEEDWDYPVQFAQTVSRRKFPRAVQRNRLKRQMREAWRLSRHRLYKKLRRENKKIAVMLLYTAAEPLPFATIKNACRKIIRRLENQLSP